MTPRSTNSAALWLETWPSRLTPLVDLICIPGAGAGASAFRSWHRKISGFISMQVVQLPGRENRIDEAPASNLNEVVECISSAYLEGRAANRPVMVFGHSMGGVIGFELVRSLQTKGLAPSALVMSSTTPPASRNDLAELSQAQLKQLLLTYDSDNQSVVENDELFESLVPVLQSDFRMLRGHAIGAEVQLRQVDGHLLSGSDDPVVPSPSVARWEQHFDGCSTTATLSGGHHFPFREAQDEVIALLNKLARQSLQRVAS